MTAPSIAWTPSRARTVTPLVPRPLRGVRIARVPLVWPGKASAALEEFTLDLSDWCRDAGDGLASADAPTVSPVGDESDLGVVWSTMSGPGITVALSGGVPGKTYTLGLRVETVLGRVGYWSVQLPINDASPAEAPQAATEPPGVAFLPDGTRIFTPAGLPTASMQIPGAAYLNGGVLTTDAAPDAGSTVRLDFTFANLPATDPGILGRLYSPGGPVVISAGPMPPQTPQDAYFASRPSADPQVDGEPWSNGGYLTFSAGVPASS